MLRLATLNEAVELKWMTEESADRARKEIDLRFGSDQLKLIVMLRYEHWGESWDEICVVPYAGEGVPSEAMIRWGLIH